MSHSRHYPELHRRPGSPYWIFRKYSSVKRAEFHVSTKVEAKENLAAEAYRRGRELFDRWQGSVLPTSRTPLFRDVARVVLDSKRGMKERTFRSARNQIENHLMPAFGHLTCDQVTRLRWDEWVSHERARHPEKRFFNPRKHLLELLRRAQEEGLIRQLPKIGNPDPKTQAGEYLTDETVRAILNEASPDTRLLAEIVWRMGARPGEVIQWRFSMINWAAGEDGLIAIPGAVTKTGRARTIPLNPKISALLRARQALSSGDLIFPSPRNSGEPVKEYKTGWKSACRRAKKSADLYWLRHTFITNCAKRGVSIVFAAKYCDTSVAMIDKVYAQATPDSLNSVADIRTPVRTRKLKAVK